MNSTPRTLAAAVAFTTVAAGIAATAPSASAVDAAPKAKTVSVRAAAYPKLVDRSGSENDTIRFTKVPGAAWKLDGDVVPFAADAKTAEVAVRAVSAATLVADTTDTTATWSLAAGISNTWNFPVPDTAFTAPIDGSALAAKVTWNDAPGVKESVTLEKVTGITWTVATGTKSATYDAAKFGKKDSVTVPATKDTVVTAAVADGYTVDPKKAIPESFAPTGLTDTATATIPAAKIPAAVSVGANPLDKYKGYGKDAGVETVKVVGIPGVTWQIGTNKAAKVTGTAYLPVDPDDIDADGNVRVTALAAKGFAIEGAAAGKTTTKVNFKDGAATGEITVKDLDVTRTENPGTAKDLLTLKGQANLTWYVGQADKNGKIAYKALKAGKDGNAVYKPTFPKPTKTVPVPDADVYLKAAPARGYVVDATALTPKVTFTNVTATVPTADLGVVADNKVTFTPITGVDSWSVKYTATVGTKTSSKSTTVKAAELTATGADNMVIDFGTAIDASKVTAKFQAGYTK